MRAKQGDSNLPVWDKTKGDKKMETKKLIKKFGIDLIVIDGEDKIRCSLNVSNMTDNDKTEIISKKAAIIQELKEEKQQEEDAQDPRKGPIEMSMYFGDWYYFNSFFRDSEVLRIQGDHFQNEAVRQLLENRVDPKQYLGRALEKYFGLKLGKTSIDADLKIETKKYNDIRGNGEYISYIIFPDFETFESYIVKALVKALQKDIEKIREKNDRINEIKEKAIKTGKRQLLNQYNDECNDPSEECNYDIIYEYILPNGEIETKRNHTW